MNNQDPKQQEQSNEPSFEETARIETDEERIMREKEEAKARSLQMRKKALPILGICVGAMIVIPLILVIILTIINKVCGVVIIFYGCKLLWSFVQLMGWVNV